MPDQEIAKGPVFVSGNRNDVTRTGETVENPGSSVPAQNIAKEQTKQSSPKVSRNKRLTFSVRSIGKIVLGLCGLVGAVSLGYCACAYLTKPWSEPKDIRVTNVTSRSVSVSWVTEEKTEGMVIFGEEDNFLPSVLAKLGKRCASDDRDVVQARLAAAEVEADVVAHSVGADIDYDSVDVKAVISEYGEYYVHHVTLTGLEPETAYYFMVGNGLRFVKAQENDDLFTAAFGSSFITFKELEDMTVPDPTYGRVVSSEGMVDDGVLFMVIENLPMSPLSGTLNEDGGWYIDLGNARTGDGDQLTGWVEETDFERIFVEAGPVGHTGHLLNSMASDAPMDPIVIGEEWVVEGAMIRPTGTGLVSYVYAAIDCSIYNFSAAVCRAIPECEWKNETCQEVIDSPAGDDNNNTPAGDGSGGPCYGGKGICINTNTDSCDGSIKIGLCPGGANIRCCYSPEDEPEQEPATDGGGGGCGDIRCGPDKSRCWTSGDGGERDGACRWAMCTADGSWEISVDCCGTGCDANTELTIGGGGAGAETQLTCEDAGRGVWHTNRSISGCTGVVVSGTVTVGENFTRLTCYRCQEQVARCNEVLTFKNKEDCSCPGGECQFVTVTGSDSSTATCYECDSSSCPAGSINTTTCLRRIWSRECRVCTGTETLGCSVCGICNTVAGEFEKEAECNRGCNKDCVPIKGIENGCYSCPDQSCPAQTQCFYPLYKDAQNCSTGCDLSAGKECVSSKVVCCPYVCSNDTDGGGKAAEAVLDEEGRFEVPSGCGTDGGWASAGTGCMCEGEVVRGEGYAFVCTSAGNTLYKVWRRILPDKTTKCDNETWYCICDGSVQSVSFGYSCSSEACAAGVVEKYRRISPGETCTKEILDGKEKCWCPTGGGPNLLKPNRIKEGQTCRDEQSEGEVDGFHETYAFVSDTYSASTSSLKVVPNRGHIPGYASKVSPAVFAQEITDTDTILLSPQQGLFSFSQPGVYCTRYLGDEYCFDILDSGEVQLYVDVNGDGVFSEGDLDFSSGATQLEVTQETSLEIKEISKGFNIISFDSVLNGESMMVSGVLTAINEEYGDVLYSISEFQNGKWVVVESRGGELYGADDFQIIPGRGYLFKARYDFMLRWEGKAVIDPVPVYLQGGWNLAAVHGSSVSYTASSLIDSISQVESLEADNVTEWNASSSRYSGLQKEADEEGTMQVYGFDFPIDDKLGYFVRIAEGSGVWVPE